MFSYLGFIHVRHLLCTIFVRKTACQKYFFQILSQKKRSSDCESQKSGFGFDPKNPPRMCMDFMDSRFVFEFAQKTQNPFLDPEIRI